MDNVLWLVIVIVYSIAFVAQLVVNVVNFLRTGKLTKMTFNPSIREDVSLTYDNTYGKIEERLNSIGVADVDLEQAKASLISFHEAQLKKLRGD